MTEYNVAKKHIYDNAQVFDNARVSGNTLVSGKTQVSGNARVSDNALVSGHARVYGILRSDNYCFVFVPCNDGQNRVIAGCRYFTMPEARAHWDCDEYNKQNLRAETVASLNCLEILSAVKPEGAV